MPVLKPVKKCYLLCLAFATIAVAAPFDLNLNFDVLELKNGKTLKKATIKSYDHENGKVVILVDRSFTSYQIEILPDEIAQRVMALVPRETKALEQIDRADKKQDKQGAKASNAQRAREETERTQREAANAKKAQADARESQQAAQFNSQTKQLARTRADHYYRYENKPGSGSVLIVGGSFELDEPVEVTGWGKRLRISGRIGLEFYDSRGRSYNTMTAKFEVTTEMDDKGIVKVVDFSPNK